jgi:probable phosphoglycerate mutase
VLVVSHKATNRLLLCSLMGIDERLYREKVTQDLACLNVLKFKAPSQARVVVMNDVSHYLTVPTW